MAKRSGEVIAGHTRLRAALEIGIAEVPVVWFDGSDIDAVAYNIADNRTHEFATWDESALATILKELRAEDSLNGVGYSTDDIDALLAEIGHGTAPNEFEDPGPQEPTETPVSKLGDLWTLGNHKLLCGDSAKADDVARVLGGEKATLLSTRSTQSPPSAEVRHETQTAIRRIHVLREPRPRSHLRSRREVLPGR